MDERAFALLIEPYRRALHLHCYRMLGSLHDADDALQETMLRAWKGVDRYEPRAQLSAWLHAIATNVCLTALAKRRREADRVEDLVHLQPYPDRYLDELEEGYVLRETVELAFVIAIQLLPPKQRAALILRDVLGWSAREAADALGDSITAVNSALQRARARVGRARRVRVPAERELVQRFMAAWDAVDIDGLVALLTHDAVMTMPPEQMRIAGARAIGDFFATVPQQGRLDQIRLVPTSANRQPALAAYARDPDDGAFKPYGLMVLEVDGDAIAGIVGFPDPWLFQQCGLAPEL